MISKKEILEGIMESMVGTIERSGVPRQEAVRLFFDSLTVEDIVILTNNDAEMASVLSEVAQEMGYNQHAQVVSDL
jgi:isocitrate lyase